MYACGSMYACSWMSACSFSLMIPCCRTESLKNLPRHGIIGRAPLRMPLHGQRKHSSPADTHRLNEAVGGACLNLQRLGESRNPLTVQRIDGRTGLPVQPFGQHTARLKDHVVCGTVLNLKRRLWVIPMIL
jgi:hypothetical protein